MDPRPGIYDYVKSDRINGTSSLRVSRATISSCGMLTACGNLNLRPVYPGDRISGQGNISQYRTLLKTLEYKLACSALVDIEEF